MRDFIDGATFREMVLCACDALETNERLVNELNVFPVPDGDTGTNMYLTLSAAAADLRRTENKNLTQTADRVASALLRGARGNSGVITSLLFRGLAKGLKKLETASAPEFANAMRDGVDAAYKAIMKPTEGTILTVSRLSAEAAITEAGTGADCEGILQAALTAGNEALADTINLNPVLKKAGVVDAGGKGYMLMLEAMLAYLRGEKTASVPGESGPGSNKSKADFSSFNTEDIRYAYCTEFIIRKEGTKSADLLRAFLDAMGDCVVVVEDDEIIKTHAHTNEPGKALTEALTYGSLLTVKVENMKEQHSGLGTVEGEPISEPLAEDSTEETDIGSVPMEKPIGIVAVCAGDGLEDLFRQLGADELVSGGQTMNPSTEDILRRINRTPAETVFVFPNNKNIIMAAEQCVPLTDRRVIVIPSRTIPQGISALMRYDPSSSPESLTKEFSEALNSVHTAQVTYAARDSEYDGYSIHAGEYLALMEGRLIGANDSLEELTEALCRGMEELEPEFITVYAGVDVNDSDAGAMCNSVSAYFPEAETALIRGNQPVYYYMISIE